MTLRTDPEFARTDRIVRDLSLHTVCRSARCPNRHECWNRATATFMIMGDACTRNCLFCAVAGGVPDGPPDSDEPDRVAEAARRLGLRHVVVTSVTRDDLPDGGARFFARTIGALRSACPAATVEVLTPDFRGIPACVRIVLDAAPDVFNHNLETVRRLQGRIRPRADYERSLSVLKQAARAGRPGLRVKTGLMLGMGESREEIIETLRDIVAAGCHFLTLGQYLPPSRRHLPVARFLPPEEFEALAKAGRELGLAEVVAGPLVRSSYRAEQLIGGG